MWTKHQICRHHEWLPKCVFTSLQNFAEFAFLLHLLHSAVSGGSARTGHSCSRQTPGGGNANNCSALTNATKSRGRGVQAVSQDGRAHTDVRSGRISESTCVGGPMGVQALEVKHFHAYCRIINAWGYNSANTRTPSEALMCRWLGVVPRQSSWINWTLELYSGMWQTVSQTTSQSHCTGKKPCLNKPATESQKPSFTGGKSKHFSPSHVIYGDFSTFRRQSRTLEIITGDSRQRKCLSTENKVTNQSLSQLFGLNYPLFMVQSDSFTAKSGF